MLYGRLPTALGEDQPFYGLDTLPFDTFTGDNWVETMLEDHVAQIKRIQPSGPYQLAGWCFAGLMAYEVARRLEQRGDQVSMLALLDSWNPCRPAWFRTLQPGKSSAPRVRSRHLPASNAALEVQGPPPPMAGPWHCRAPRLPQPFPSRPGPEHLCPPQSPHKEHSVSRLQTSPPSHAAVPSGSVGGHL